MKAPVLLLLAAALATGCGDGNGDTGSGGETTAAEPGTATFRSDAIGFAFDYPRALVADRRVRRPVLGQVSVERGSPLNAVKVRRTAGRELEAERYLDEFQRDFERTVGTVEKRAERVGEREFGVLEFEDSVTRAGEEVEFTSVSYFFAGGGRTWQIECIADRDHRDAIADACRIALESIEFRGAE